MPEMAPGPFIATEICMTDKNDGLGLSPAEAALREAALDYHRTPTRGKIAVTPTKPLANQRDLSLAYSPGVAYPCLDIEKDPTLAAEYTSRGNLVGVVTNGTAVLGLGDIGPLAAKPVMEGKGCLFKKFAGIDVFDIELAERDPDKLVEIIAAMEPTLGGVNLEDIKAPECFYIEKKLRERMKIPVFHDDQHGTAIISSAAILNGLKVVNKDIGKVKLACSGAGAAAIACLDLLVHLGVKRENIYVVDSRGVIWDGRDENMEANKKRYAAPEYRKFSYVRLEPQDISDPSAISDTQVKEDYEKNTSRYTTPETRAIEQLVFKSPEAAKAAFDSLKAGATFDKLITAEGKTEADTQLGTLAKDKIADKAVADAAFSLNVNEVSPVVQGTFGVERHRLTWTGQAAHAGSTPMDKRRDALAGAAKLALDIRRIAAETGGGAVCTSGDVVCRPGIVTSVVETAEQLLDQRHLVAGKLAAMLAQAKRSADGFAAEERIEVSQ